MRERASEQIRKSACRKTKHSILVFFIGKHHEIMGGGIF